MTTSDSDRRRTAAYADEAAALRRELAKLILQDIDQAPFDEQLRAIAQGWVRTAIATAFEDSSVRAALQHGVLEQARASLHSELDGALRKVQEKLSQSVEVAFATWSSQSLDRRIDEVSQRLAQQLREAVERETAVASKRLEQLELGATDRLKALYDGSGIRASSAKGAGTPPREASTAPRASEKPGPGKLSPLPEAARARAGWLAGLIALALFAAALFGWGEWTWFQRQHSRGQPQSSIGERQTAIQADGLDRPNSSSRSSGGVTGARARQAEDLLPIWREHVVRASEVKGRVPVATRSELDEAFECWFRQGAAAKLATVVDAGFSVDRSSPLDEIWGDCLRKNYPIRKSERSVAIVVAQLAAMEVDRAALETGICPSAFVELRGGHGLSIDGLVGGKTVQWVDAVLECGGVPASFLGTPQHVEDYVFGVYVALDTLRLAEQAAEKRR